MNTGWQYCALPVTINESKYGSVQSIKFIFDYTNNVGSAQFFGMTLKEGKWEYAEFNDDRQKVYSEASSSKSYTTYEYLDNRLIKQKTTKDKQDYLTEYFYNSQGSVIRVVKNDCLISQNMYNKNGQVIKSFTYHKDDPASKIYSTDDILDEKGQKTGEYSELGSATEYTYVDDTNIISSSRVDDSVVSYGYDFNDDRLLSASASSGGENNSNEYHYTHDLLTGLTHNGFDYDFEYDGFGRQTQASIAGDTYLVTQYDTYKTTTRYASQEVFEAQTDKSGNITQVLYTDQDGNTSTLSHNSYDTYGRLISIDDYSNSSVPTSYALEYDKDGNLNSKSYAQNNKNISIHTTIEDNERTSCLTIGDIVDTTVSKFSQDLDSKLTEIDFSSNVTQTIAYDNLGRASSTTLGSILSKKYNYLQNGDHATNLISSEWFGDSKSLRDSYKYSYDKKGNITSISENGELITRYTYDDLSRLIREDNKRLNKTSVFCYDNGGNITARHNYTYSLAAGSELSGGTLDTYSYPISGWRDQLLAYNDETFSYDSLGNPKKYRGKDLVWSKCRQLSNFGGIEYKYNADGIRISKTYNNITTHYYLDGNKILAQDNGNVLVFRYGVDGIVGFNYVGVGEYYYKKNIFGDIIGIFDSNRQEVVKYIYDSWGNHRILIFNGETFVDIDANISYTQTSLINNKNIAQMNPFRYRGYYYDTETGLYYLSSRYYDPELGRFINADSISILSESKDFINGLNLYSYCNNNPVMNIDSDGEAWWHWILGAFIILVGVAATVVTAGGFGAAFSAIAGVFGIGTTATGTLGIVAGITASTITSSIVGGFLGGINTAINGGNFWDGASEGFFWGAIGGALSGGFGAIGFGIGDLLIKGTNIAVGNIVQSIGQSAISLGLYAVRSATNNEQITLAGVFFSIFGGVTGGLISYSSFKVQFIVNLFNELASFSADIFKKVAKIPQSWII